MNKTIVGGLTAILMTSGVGLTAASAQASPSPTTATRAPALVLPLDLCTVLPVLCGTGGVDEALDALLADPTAPTAVPGLVDAVLNTLLGTPADQRPELANAIAGLLANADLSQATVDQIIAGLSGSPVGDLVNNVLETVTELVSDLLGLGGQSVDPARVDSLVQEILAALAGGDTAKLSEVLTGLLQSLPGGSALDASTLTDLVGDLSATLANASTGGDTTDVVDRVDNALNPAASATPKLLAIKKFVTTKTAKIRGGGTPGASVTVRTSKGAVLGTATVSSGGSFSLVSSKLARGAYTVTATQIAPGMGTSASSAARKFRVVSATPAITTKANKSFGTHRPKISGIAYPKTKIVLRSSTGKILGTARVHTNGKWTIKSKNLTSGSKKIKAVQTGHGKKKTSKAKKIRVR